MSGMLIYADLDTKLNVLTIKVDGLNKSLNSQFGGLPGVDSKLFALGLKLDRLESRYIYGRLVVSDSEVLVRRTSSVVMWDRITNNNMCK